MDFFFRDCHSCCDMPERCCIHNAVGNAPVRENLNESIASVTVLTNGSAAARVLTNISRIGGIRNIGPAMTAFDYNVEAVLFNSSPEVDMFRARGRKSGRQPVGYRRFVRASDAIRFAIEELPPELLAEAYLEVDEARFDRCGIRHLYESIEYPLVRHAAAFPMITRTLGKDIAFVAPRAAKAVPRKRQS